jgi:hypothetical protein
MATTETSAAAVCSEHPDRPSVGTCGRCGRTLCLECAIPFRGSLRCDACAAIELGDPAPPPAPRRRRLGLSHLAVGAAIVATLATVAPWHRSGTLTGVFTAWRGLDPWATTAAVATMLGLAAFGLALRRRLARRWAAAAAAAEVVAAGATVISLMRSPDFFSATPAPTVIVVASGLAALLGVLVSRRHRA